MVVDRYNRDYSVSVLLSWRLGGNRILQAAEPWGSGQRTHGRNCSPMVITCDGVSFQVVCYKYKGGVFSTIATGDSHPGELFKL